MPNPIADPLVENVDTDITSGFAEIGGLGDGHAVTVWINRPERKNAFDSTVIGALHEAFETIDNQEGIRVVFVRGRGGAFSAGADLDWMRAASDLTEHENQEDAMAMARMLGQLHGLKALTVALVEGPAFGGGAGLVAACDMAIAAKDARFAFSEVKLGLVAATVSPYVVEAIGARRARSLFATAKLFDAAFAQTIGLVDEVVADAKALEAAQVRIADDIRASGPAAVGRSKSLVAHVAGQPIDEVLMAETARRIAHARVSDEGKEGIAAFLAKRKPNWAE